jgi:predicted amidohydrolase
MHELPDLFDEVVDQLDVDAFRQHIDEWEADDLLGSASRTILNDALEGKLTVEALRTRIQFAEHNGRDVNATRFAILRALDNAFSTINPVANTSLRTTPAALRRLAYYVAAEGRLDSGSQPGGLIPRLNRAPRADELATHAREAFSSVLRVPAEHWDACTRVRVPEDAIFHRDELERGVRIGCAPLIADPAELRWETTVRGRRRYYRISPTNDPATLARIGSVLDAFAADEVQIGVVPELTLTPAILEIWMQEIAARAGSTRLQLVLVGSGNLDGGRRPDNTAVLLNGRSGERIAEQRKIYPFTFRPTELELWKLTDRLGIEAIEEDIEPGKRLTIVECGVLRLAVLVCEDLTRPLDVGHQIRSFGVSHLLVPEFARPTKDRRWERDAAGLLSRESGAVVVVANSLITRTTLTEAGATIDPEAGTGLIVTSGGGGAKGTVLRQLDPEGVAAATVHMDGQVDDVTPVSPASTKAA